MCDDPAVSPPWMERYWRAFQVMIGAIVILGVALAGATAVGVEDIRVYRFISFVLLAISVSAGAMTLDSLRRLHGGPSVRKIQRMAKEERLRREP